MRILLPGTLLSVLLVLAACGPDKETNGSGGASSATSSSSGTGGAGGEATTSSSGAGGTGGAGGGAQIDCNDPSQNPILGTCYATLTACFAPKGQCMGQDMGTGFSFTWTDGSKASLTPDPQKANTADITVLGAGGTPCIDGTIEDLHKMGGNTTVTLHDGKNPASTLVLVTPPGDAPTKVTCPDGTSFEIPTSKSNALAACDPMNVPLKQCP